MTTPEMSCLAEDNFAAIALAMQKTALEAEARIFTLEQQLRAAANRPTIVQTSTAAITGFTANTSFLPFGPLGGGNFVTNFNNTGFDRNVDSSSRQQFTVENGTGPGLYQFGAFLNAVASGVVDDNSYRVIFIEQWRQTPTGEVKISVAARTDYETNTGVGTDLTVIAEFDMTPADRVRFLFLHGNTSSTMNVSIGTIVWSSKISSTDGVVIG